MSREDEKLEIYDVANGLVPMNRCDTIIAIWRKLGVFEMTLDNVNTCTALCEEEVWSRTYKNYNRPYPTDAEIARMRKYDDQVMRRYWLTIPKSYNEVARIEVLNKDKPAKMKSKHIVVLCKPRSGDIKSNNGFRRSTIATHTSKGFMSDNSLSVPEGFVQQALRESIDKLTKLGATIEDKEKFALSWTEAGHQLQIGFAEERKLLEGVNDLEQEAKDDTKRKEKNVRE